MISFLEGLVENKTLSSLILNVNGVGYEINISSSTHERLPKEGENARVFVFESIGMYGGGTSLYGFLSQEEKDIFAVFKEGLKNTGSRKALDYLDKAMKSLPDFHKAVINKDTRLLTSIFGFRSKTAEKIVALLHDKFAALQVKGREKWSAASREDAPSETIQALVALGFKESHAKRVIENIISGMDKMPSTGELIKLALKNL